MTDVVRPLATPRPPSPTMTATDALFWYTEAANARVRPIVGGLTILAERADPRLFDDGYRRLLELAPRLRQRVAEPSLPFGFPVWVDDEHFDLSYHLRHISVPKPGRHRDLLDLVATLLATPIDRQRPPWEAYWIDGVRSAKGEKTAYFFKMHHSLADGVGSIALFDLMTTKGRDDPLPRVAPRAPVPRGAAAAASPSLLGVAFDAAATAVGAIRTIGGGTAAVLAHPLETWDSVARSLGAIRGLASDLASPTTSDPLVGSACGLSRRLDTHRISLDRLRALADGCGATINDVVLTALSAALGAYHRERGVPVETLHCMVPVNLRAAAERESLGNRVGMLNVVLPLGEMPLGRRLDAIRQQTARGKRDERGRSYPFLFEALAFLPSVGLRWITRQSLARVNVVCTNVPGLGERRFMAGAEVEACYPFVSVVEGIPVMMALLSYAGTMDIGLDTDPEAIPDPERITALFEEALSDPGFGAHGPVAAPAS